MEATYESSYGNCTIRISHYRATNTLLTLLLSSCRIICHYASRPGHTPLRVRSQHLSTYSSPEVATMADQDGPASPSQRMVNMRQMESFRQRFDDYNEPAYGSRFFSQSCLDNNK
jgi:hypothetical protein